MKPVYPIMVTCDNQPAMVTAPNAGMPEMKGKAVDGGPGSGPRPGSGKGYVGSPAYEATVKANNASHEADGMGGAALHSAASAAHANAAKLYPANSPDWNHHQFNTKRHADLASKDRPGGKSIKALYGNTPNGGAGKAPYLGDEAPTWQGRDLDSANPDAPADHGMDSPGCGAWPGRVE